MVKFYIFSMKRLFNSFIFGISSKSGRNFLGRICVQHRGGASRSKFLKIDRFRCVNNSCLVLSVFKNFNYTGFLGYVYYDLGISSIILLSEGVLKGIFISSGDGGHFPDNRSSFSKKGSTQSFFRTNLFDHISSIEIFPFSGFRLVRSAGSSAKLISKTIDGSVLKLSSGWQLKLSNNCLCTLGIVSNPSHKFSRIKNAGFQRKLGIRPTVRGVIKNPCDHPHGGGEGRGSPPKAQVSPWGWFCKGTPSKNKKIDRLKRRLFKFE